MATLQFKGKPFVQNYHLTVKYHELIPKKTKSLTKKVSLHDNLIIHGDNLKALKALLPTYAGKVKCIYIDPPYNTGNEHWAYNDNVNSPMMQEWLGKVVDREDLTRHDKWLCMMMPRLRLLRELMRDDGVIFVSIDDNEAPHLRMLMDEIFGESNFIANIVWQKKQSPQNDAIYLSDMHDHILVYARRAKTNRDDPGGWERQLLERGEEQDKRYTNPDGDARGDWTSVDYSCNKTARERPNLYYPIQNPNTGEKVWPSRQRVWRFDKAAHKRNVEEKRIWWGAGGDNFPRLKRFRSEVERGIVPSTWWDRTQAGDNQEARRELRTIFGDEIEQSFETPKPVRLIKRMLQISVEIDPTKPQTDIILDSFAGSGTTAHAVLAMNKETGGDRKFILVECEDYADAIAAERVRRVIKGLPKVKDETLREGLGGTFSYFELGKPIEMESILEGKDLPTYNDLARYAFYTATGEEFDEGKVDETRNFIGESKEYEVYLFYKPDIDYLKQTALTLDRAKALGAWKGKRRLVFAPAKYLDQEHLLELRVDFAQLPFEIYKFAE
ncbi:MAG: site-specific DNA-methyltransferase [Candidatus Eisenbacteria bacterium]|nr:site-specific DNA-methyltransferase [Candidatus Eisenbacteria bacterium]